MVTLSRHVLWSRKRTVLLEHGREKRCRASSKSEATATYPCLYKRNKQKFRGLYKKKIIFPFKLSNGRGKQRTLTFL